MPIYDYKCQGCGETSEIFQRTISEVKVVCPHCGSEKLEKQFSAPGFFVKDHSRPKGRTCCGREERCDTPACSTGEGCRRDERNEF
jgi:putative FmdB family regulatory protein